MWKFESLKSVCPCSKKDLDSRLKVARGVCRTTIPGLYGVEQKSMKSTVLSSFVDCKKFSGFSGKVQLLRPRERAPESVLVRERTCIRFKPQSLQFWYVLNMFWSPGALWGKGKPITIMAIQRSIPQHKTIGFISKLHQWGWTSWMNSVKYYKVR